MPPSIDFTKYTVQPSGEPPAPASASAPVAPPPPPDTPATPWHTAYDGVSREELEKIAWHNQRAARTHLARASELQERLRQTVQHVGKASKTTRKQLRAADLEIARLRAENTRLQGELASAVKAWRAFQLQAAVYAILLDRAAGSHPLPPMARRKPLALAS